MIVCYRRSVYIVYPPKFINNHEISDKPLSSIEPLKLQGQPPLPCFRMENNNSEGFYFVNCFQIVKNCEPAGTVLEELGSKDAHRPLVSFCAPSKWQFPATALSIYPRRTINTKFIYTINNFLQKS